MDYVIFLGILITIIGVITMLLTPRERLWGGIYRSKNVTISRLALILIIFGLIIIIVKALFNGQLG
ncbi:hypothetical protein [Periweissella fabalis]|uniref:Uncharacterized protein n=1 Tax=Periweissella fabalis TaxID=1070421 RepID=A0A7X6S350_9LACO|nr:hypothetical protein [Periweissella fabalis]MCM0599318.1 hypothetical protein [Periweissella fabalis]NKZ23597.1 hypothetical protein [Periweissella fabalis]